MGVYLYLILCLYFSFCLWLYSNFHILCKGSFFTVNTQPRFSTAVCCKFWDRRCLIESLIATALKGSSIFFPCINLSPLKVNIFTVNMQHPPAWLIKIGIIIISSILTLCGCCITTVKWGCRTFTEIHYKYLSKSSKYAIFSPFKCIFFLDINKLPKLHDLSKTSRLFLPETFFHNYATLLIQKRCVIREPLKNMFF